MDWIYNLIEAASSLVDKDKGMLIIHRNMKVHPKFKVYKTFSYSIYLVKNKQKELLLEWETTKNVSESIMEVWKDSDIEFLPKLIDWLSSESFIKLKNEV